MWRVQFPLIDKLDEKLAHGLRRQQIVPALGLAKAGKIDGNEARVLRERLPDRQECIQALGPGIRQQNEAVPVPVALSITDRDSIHGSEPDLHVSTRCGTHHVSPSLCSSNELWMREGQHVLCPSPP